jgi:hypothetical protein
LTWFCILKDDYSTNLTMLHECAWWLHSSFTNLIQLDRPPFLHIMMFFMATIIHLWVVVLMGFNKWEVLFHNGLGYILRCKMFIMLTFFVEGTHLWVTIDSYGGLRCQNPTIMNVRILNNPHVTCKRNEIKLRNYI